MSRALVLLGDRQPTGRQAGRQAGSLVYLLHCCDPPAGGSDALEGSAVGC